MWNAEGVERSVTPSAAWYYDPDLYRLELERIFARSWSFVGSTSDLARPGDYFTVDVAGEPVVVARGKDDRIRAFSNVCRHRAGPVAEGKGRRQSFVCGYHGWCYGLDGRLIAARDMDRRPGFDVDHIRLPEFQVAIWEPFVFVSLSGDMPLLEAWLAPLPEIAPDWRPETMRLATVKTWKLDCNWKVFGENFCEGYHLPYVHPGFTEAIGLGEYRTTIRGPLVSEQWAPEGHPRGPGTRIAKAFGCTTAELRAVIPALPSLRGVQRESYFFYFIFPGMALSFAPDGMSVIRLNPISPERCEISYWSWFPPELETKDVIRDALLILFGHQIQDEDKGIVEQLQPRFHSREYVPGPYSPGWEGAVYHFTHLVEVFKGAGSAREALDTARLRYAAEPSAAPA